jgi:hypothetical protein
MLADEVMTSIDRQSAAAVKLLSPLINIVRPLWVSSSLSDYITRTAASGGV